MANRCLCATAALIAACLVAGNIVTADARRTVASAGAVDSNVPDRFDLARRRPNNWLKDSEFKFKLPDLEGNMVAHNDSRFKNKVVLYDIWGTWCPPCREMTPFLKRLNDEFGARGLVVVGIAMEYEADEGEDPKAGVARYLEEHEINYLTLFAGAHESPSELVFSKLTFREFDGFPTVVIVGRDGEVVRIEEGWDDTVRSGIESTIKELLK